MTRSVLVACWCNITAMVAFNELIDESSKSIFVLQQQLINGTYLVATTFATPDCSGSLAPVGAYSLVVGQCYGGSGRSYKYTYSSGAATVAVYTDDGCGQFAGTIFNGISLGGCTQMPLTDQINRYVSFTVSELPLNPTPGFYFYEKHITASNCSDTTNAARALIMPTQEACARSETFDRFINNISPQDGVGLEFNYASVCGEGVATLYSASCPVGGAVPDNIAYATVVPAYQLQFAPITTVTLNTITIPGFTSAWPSYLTYSMPGYTITYQVNGAGTTIPITTNCPATGCVLTFPMAAANINLYAIPNHYAPPGLFVQSATQPIKLKNVPKVTAIDFTRILNDSITFKYTIDDSSYGSDTTYIVKVNGVENTSNSSCLVGPSCTISGLAATFGSNQIMFSVMAVTKTFTSTEFSSNTTLYKPVTNIEITTLTARTKSFSLLYKVIGGDQRFPILQYVDVNGELSASCSGILTTPCLTTGLQPNSTNSILFIAQSNGDQYKQSTSIQTLPIISGQTLTVVNFTTKAVTVEYSYNGGVPGETTVTFTVDSVSATCTPVQGLTSQCTISSMTSGSEHVIVATFSNDGTQVTAQTTVTTYPSVANTTAIINQHASYFNVTYGSSGGIPGATTYKALVNGAPVDLATGYFIYTYENERYPSEETFTIVVRATNDGIVSQNVFTFTTYVPPSGFITRQLFGVNSVNLTWTELVGGQADSTYYQAILAFEGGPNILKCNTTGFYCFVDNLVSDVEYQYAFYAYNSFFNPLYNSGDSHTYPEPNSNCTDDCNGQGKCVIGNCECDQGWDGPSCNIKLSSNTTQDIVLTPTTTNQPILSISFNNQVKYSIGLLKLVEKDTATNTDVNSLDLTTLTWTSSGNSFTFSGEGLSIFFGATQVNENNEEAYFAGQRYNNTVGSILYNITISGWMFASPSNQFEIHTSISNPTICNKTLTPSTLNTPNNLTSSLLIGDATQSEALLQGKLVHSSMVDTLPNIITYRSESGGSVNTTTIVAITPTFNQSITIQPSFHLINRNLTQECTDDNLVSSAPISNPSFNSSYIIATSYRNSDCSGQIISSYAGIIDQCYKGGGLKSYKYTYDRMNGWASIISYRGDNCQIEVDVTVHAPARQGYGLRTCSMNE
ncbi:hypothetical protein DFA_06231 [Cavenderia fasciculata]|uniref:EGF-like domain-containing protein n=1 Tax=Cavenderia fasciculata TaxID=261658 RepID=F4PKG8_CACFS|nr:uncharacterized protein DFA_06231 [Cavenderia fasciculata]EGG24092.1 hypothetical protein DFA_06231 [Cavenderia fasciculata]|eukprot:XP_004361943.1 hypothetical protein DFA_06231 [Cavenderia fasciculata]